MIYLKKKKVGIFDSGIGGVSILNQLMKYPIQEFVYVADTAHLPYGEKSHEFLLERACIIVDFMHSQAIDSIVIACHTSSATTLHRLKELYPSTTFIDMLQPTIYKACAVTRTNIIGVIATVATLKTHVHQTLIHQQGPFIVVEQPCPRLVPLLEGHAYSGASSFNSLDQEELKIALQQYLEPILQAGADTLILGCTHYLFLRPLIQQLAPSLHLVGADEHVAELFDNYPVETTTALGTFYVSGELALFATMLKLFLTNKTHIPVIKKFSPV